MINELLTRAYAPMDRQTGMFPKGWTCRRCSVELDKDGMHPAELYAGTYTGLCYKCEGSGPYVSQVYTLDGAYTVSYPPSCPSWRRDRETFTAYADCETCRGTGVQTRAGYYVYGDQHRTSCDPCASRYYAHPARVKSVLRSHQLYRAAEAVWQANLERIARTTLPKKPRKKDLHAATGLLARSPRTNAIRAEILARHTRAMRLLPAYPEASPPVSALPAAA